jgi:hypothetical protein
MDAFRSAVATVESGHPTTFRSAFSAEQGLDPPAAAPSPVSVKALLAAARTLAPSDPPPATLRAVARLFTPSLRMNPDGVDLPRGRACRFQRGLAVRDLARRLL